jgi:hypothetical protein
MTCVMMIFNLTHAAKIGRAARPLEPYDKANPTRAFVARRGEGRVGGGGVLLGLKDRKGRRWARRNGNGIFSMHLASPQTRV